MAFFGTQTAHAVTAHNAGEHIIHHHNIHGTDVHGNFLQLFTFEKDKKFTTNDNTEEEPSGPAKKLLPVKAVSVSLFNTNTPAYIGLVHKKCFHNYGHFTNISHAKLYIKLQVFRL